MEHLPKVEEPFHRELEIPLFVKSGQGYDGKGVEDFLSFPSKQGYNLERLKFGDFGEKTFEDVVSCIQAWGYFGMLTEVLRVSNINMQFQFPVGEGASRYVSTNSKALPDLIRIWYDLEEEADAATKEAHSKTVSQITRAVRDLVAGIRHQEFRGGIVSSSSKILDEGEEILKPSDVIREPYNGHNHEFGMMITDKYYERNRNFYTDEKGWGDEKIKIGDINWNLGRVGSKAHQLMLSIVILGEALTNAASVIYEDFDNFSWPSVSLVSVLLECVGWCPFQVSQLHRRGTNSHLYYLSFFNQQQFSKSHKSCCKDYCLAYQVDEKTYETRHVKEDCKCEFISFDEQAVDVSKWIEHGQTPLVKREVNGAGEGTQKTWRLLPSRVDDKVTRYACISHVWGDGMGNPVKNSLPECQLDKIQNAVNAVFESDCDIPLWIDTISIPFQHPLRKYSIRSMAKIYQEAECVLVLDNTLTNVNVEASIEEIMTRIEVSGWMTRLWTLSEGVTASNLYFQLRQRAVKIEELQFDYRLRRIKADMERLQNISEDKNNVMAGVLARQLQGIEPFSSTNTTHAEMANLEFNEIYYSVSRSLGQIRLPKRMPEEQLTNNYGFYWMLVLLNGRNTSKGEDEPICIANLLGIDVQPMLEMDPETWMLSLLLTYSHLIPSGIIFGNKPRIQRPGCRWAPLSLMQPDFNWSGKAERVTANGIYAYYSALSFRPSTAAGLSIHFGLIDCSSGTRYLVDIHGIAENEMVVMRDTTYIIIECPLGQKDQTKGLLVDVFGGGDGCTSAAFVASIVIRDLGARKHLPDHECVSADPIVPNRLWRIG